MVRRLFTLLTVAVLAASCRSTGGGAAIEPLRATTAEEALAELRARGESFRGARALMRVRTTTKGEADSFRAQLDVGRGDEMRLTVFTPVGTTAVTIMARGDRISSRDARGGIWEGTASEFAGRYGFFSAAITPAAVARLVLGLPVRGAIEYDVAPSGLRTARAADFTIRYDPPSFPARRLVIRRGSDVAEIEHLEVISR